MSEQRMTSAKQDQLFCLQGWAPPFSSLSLRPRLPLDPSPVLRNSLDDVWPSDHTVMTDLPTGLPPDGWLASGGGEPSGFRTLPCFINVSPRLHHSGSGALLLYPL